tara:strand:- start:2083 stop:2364 length:282 start_codon:yes stop_codon:yes gene_type:complete
MPKGKGYGLAMSDIAKAKMNRERESGAVKSAYKQYMLNANQDDPSSEPPPSDIAEAKNEARYKRKMGAAQKQLRKTGPKTQRHPISPAGKRGK